jgi:hypothetical protein
MLQQNHADLSEIKIMFDDKGGGHSPQRLSKWNVVRNVIQRPATVHTQPSEYKWKQFEDARSLMTRTGCQCKQSDTSSGSSTTGSIAASRSGMMGNNTLSDLVMQAVMSKRSKTSHGKRYSVYTNGNDKKATATSGSPVKRDLFTHKLVAAGDDVDVSSEKDNTHSPRHWKFLRMVTMPGRIMSRQQTTHLDNVDHTANRHDHDHLDE